MEHWNGGGGVVLLHLFNETSYDSVFLELCLIMNLCDEWIKVLNV